MNFTEDVHTILYPSPPKKKHNTQDITRQSKSCYITAWGNSKINSNLGVSIRFDFKSEVAQSIFKFSVCRHNHVVKWRPCTLLQATIDNESSWYEGSIRKKKKKIGGVRRYTCEAPRTWQGKIPTGVVILRRNYEWIWK